MSDTSPRDHVRDTMLSAAMSSERIEGDDNVWTRRLVLFLRIMAVVSILQGLYHWAQVTGFIGGEKTPSRTSRWPGRPRPSISP